MASRILLWALCAVVGLWGVITYVRLSFRLWLKAVGSQPPPSQRGLYLAKAALATVAVFAAAYGALLVYDLALVDWLEGFLVVTTVVVLATVGNLWLRIYLMAESAKRESGNDRDDSR